MPNQWILDEEGENMVKMDIGWKSIGLILLTVFFGVLSLVGEVLHAPMIAETARLCMYAAIVCVAGSMMNWSEMS